MELEWMSKYRSSVEAVIRMCNTYMQTSNLQGLVTRAAHISTIELQVLEYLLENEERHENMSRVAQRLQISQSTFSKMVKQLVEKGLLEKYHTAANSKNIIICVSEKGREVYMKYTESAKVYWKPVFDALDNVPPEYIKFFDSALNGLSASILARLDQYEKEEKREMSELIPIQNNKDS